MNVRSGSDESSQLDVVSALIPSYNCRELLRRCLETLEASTGTFTLETIVVDNGSSDGTSEMIRADFPRVILIRNESTRSYSPAINQALRKSTGEKILLLNSDIELPSDAVEKMLRHQEKDVVAVVPLLRGLDGEPQTQYTFRKLPTIRDVVLNLLFFTSLTRLLRLSIGWERFDAPIDEDAYVEQPSAACMLIEGGVFRDLDGMDESLPLWFNDIDLCKRLRLRGRRIRYLHDVSVVHVGGAAISQMSTPIRVERLYRDTMSYVRKWHPRALLLVRATIFLNLVLRSIVVLTRPKQWRGWMAAMPRLVAPITSRT